MREGEACRRHEPDRGEERAAPAPPAQIHRMCGFRISDGLFARGPRPTLGDDALDLRRPPRTDLRPGPLFSSFEILNVGEWSMKHGDFQRATPRNRASGRRKLPTFILHLITIFVKLQEIPKPEGVRPFPGPQPPLTAQRRRSRADEAGKLAMRSVRDLLGKFEDRGRAGGDGPVVVPTVSNARTNPWKRAAPGNKARPPRLIHRLLVLPPFHAKKRETSFQGGSRPRPLAGLRCCFSWGGTLLEFCRFH